MKSQEHTSPASYKLLAGLRLCLCAPYVLIPKTLRLAAVCADALQAAAVKLAQELCARVALFARSTSAENGALS